MEFLDPAPEKVTVLFLFFHPDWILVHVDAQFFLQVGPFPEHMILSIISKACLLYTSPSPRDKRQSRMPSSA